MRYLYAFSFLCLFSSFTNETTAQSTAESLLIHLDKPFYVGGETIWYQLFFPKSFEGRDLALKAAVVDGKYQPLGDHFLRTKGKLFANGYFKIPYEVRSQVYHFLIIGTNEKSKKKIKLAEVFIPIYNDLTEDTSTQIVNELSEPPFPTLEGLTISLDLDQRTYHKREEIQARVKVADYSGKPVVSNISIVVKDAHLIQSPGYQPHSIHQTPLPAEILAANLTSDIYINGEVQTLDGNSLQTAIIGAYSSLEQQFYYTQPDAEGKFALKLPSFKGSKPIQFIDFQRDDLQIKIKDGIELSPTPALVFTAEIRQYLRWSRMRKKIHQFFGSLEFPLEIEAFQTPLSPVEPDQRLVIKNYLSFEDLFVFFNEIVTPFKLRKKGKNGFIARMFNPEQQIRQFYKGHPIFIVDGQLTRNANFIYQIPIENIDTIDLYYNSQSLKQQFGPMGNSGIVVLKTNLSKLEVPPLDSGNIFTLNGFQPEGKPAAPKSVSPQQAKFTPQLLWLPSTPAADNGQYIFSFSQSDDIGNFYIEVVAQDEKGARGYAVKSYTVK